MSSSPSDKVQEPIDQARPEIREIITRILKIEKERLHQKAPRHIIEDLATIIKEVIQ